MSTFPTLAATALGGANRLATELAPGGTYRADFSDTPWWLTLIKALLVFVYLLLSVVVVIWFERRIVGFLQQRPGPNRFGPGGIFQTLADGFKLVWKETFTPANADRFMYNLAPIIAGSTAFIGFSIIPLAGEVNLFGHRTPLQLTDGPVAVLLVLAAGSIAAYGFILAGWSSGSTYPLLGGLRSTAQVISYEIAMGLSLVAVFLYAGSMSTSEIVAKQASLWFLIPAIFSFIVYVICMFGETNRLPFDLAEGEGEIVGGYHTEYSGMKFGMFFLGEYVNMFTVSALATTLFLGGWQAPPPLTLINDGMLNHGWWGLLWFTLKLWGFMFFFVWVRGTLPRTRYDHFMAFGWKLLIPLTLVWVMAVAFVRAAMLGHLGDTAITAFGRSFYVSLLIIIGVFLLGAVVATWLIESRNESRREAARPEQPAEIDPFAGGHPVPPMPGQTLREPTLSSHRTVTAAPATGRSSANDHEEDHRG
ncbi:NADH-quinone oxidoreductase subunit NuoH [Arsenicicoccus bolidensis]|uniref:NADH-quinone oxidoreductase subunit H n=1 Tax=Arsenicicoccus bolidensis TaxID=229480 RepID=A0ABS9Q0N2_9MICO|nr:NADH-quinone oxidoreductase subunit NuoH [Arsenicicoccus bolidensis]MCG7321439.1 NADH-quinone oxidoreductase subunit NuoH [Arsenicicoccus bolidensis]